jgi:hypothetical protein
LQKLDVPFRFEGLEITPLSKNGQKLVEDLLTVFLPKPSKFVERLNVKDKKKSIGNNLPKKKSVSNYN